MIEKVATQRFLDEIEFCKEFNIAANPITSQIGLRVIDDNGDEKYYCGPINNGSLQSLTNEAVFMIDIKNALEKHSGKYASVEKWNPSGEEGLYP